MYIFTFVITLFVLFFCFQVLFCRTKSDEEIEAFVCAKPYCTKQWQELFPEKDLQIRDFLELFCFSFSVSEELWGHFSPTDDVNIVYDFIYSLNKQWWRRPMSGDHLEHNLFETVLVETTGREITDTMNQLITLEDVFRYFYE